MLFCSCNDVLWQMFFCFLHLLYSPSNSGAGAVKMFLLSACWFLCRLSLVHIVNVIRTAYTMTIKILRFGVCKECCFLYVLGLGRVVVSIAILNFNHQNICCSFFFLSIIRIFDVSVFLIFLYDMNDLVVFLLLFFNYLFSTLAFNFFFIGY